MPNVICVDKPFHVVGRHRKETLRGLGTAVGNTAGFVPRFVVNSSPMYIPRSH